MIAVLDVLGWRNAEANNASLETNWHVVVNATHGGFADACSNYKTFSSIKYQDYVVDTDMFILAAWQDSDQIDYALVEFVSAVLNAFIVTGLSRTIRLRGCISVGKFNLGDDLFLTGSALDEAIAEHNKINWVGCHTTKNATTALDGIIPKYKVLTDTFVGIKDPPFKDAALISQRWALNWPFAYFKQTGEINIRQILQDEITKATDDSVKKKYENTLKFFEKVFAHLEAREKRRAERAQKKT